MNIERRLADAVYRSHFGAFAYAAFEALNPGQRLVSNWHIDAVCYCIQQMVIGQSRKRDSWTKGWSGQAADHGEANECDQGGGIAFEIARKAAIGRATVMSPLEPATPFLHIGETDCVADHIGFELRCAERKFISLTCRVSSNSSISAETTAVPWENDLLCWSGTAPDRGRLFAHTASRAPE